MGTIFLGLNVSRLMEMGSGLCVTPERKGRRSWRNEYGTRAGRPYALCCTPPRDHSPFWKATTLKMLQMSGFLLKISLNMSFSVSLLRAEFEATFRCL